MAEQIKMPMESFPRIRVCHTVVFFSERHCVRMGKCQQVRLLFFI